MSAAFTIARIAGTKVRVHATFLILLVWVAAESAAAGGHVAAATGVAFVVLLFACVVAHEFGHILAARRYGVRTPEIILLPIGGVSLMERLPERPAHELAVALAGPAVSVALGLALLAVSGAPGGSEMTSIAPAQLLPTLAAANLFLALFNMLPAFPMDGGRALRALLAIRQDRVRATRTATMLGHAFAVMFGLFGLASGNLMLALLGVFIYFGASAEAADTELMEFAGGLPVSRVMRVELRSLPPGATLDDCLEVLIRTGQDAVPVVDRDGSLLGVATMAGVIRAANRLPGDAPVAEAMETDVPAVGQDHSLRDAIERMQAMRAPAVIAVDDHGAPVGMITQEGLADLRTILRKARRDHAARSSAAFGRS